MNTAQIAAEKSVTVQRQFQDVSTVDNYQNQRRSSWVYDTPNAYPLLYQGSGEFTANTSSVIREALCVVEVDDQ